MQNKRGLRRWRNGVFEVVRVVVAASVILALSPFAPALSQNISQPSTPEIEIIVGSRNALDQFCSLSIESIPQGMLAKAEGIAILPNMIKGGFILGVNYGKGVLLVRRPDRTWSPPVMVTMGGGSLGFQAGVQTSDIVLVFATPRSLEGIVNGRKVTLGADASVALGPIGRTANAGTDAALGAEIYSYARSRGLFLGVSLNGADVSVDHAADAMLYGRSVNPADIFSGRGLVFHPEVEQLIEDIDARTRVAAISSETRLTSLPGSSLSQPQTVPLVALPSTPVTPSTSAPLVSSRPIPVVPPASVSNPPLVPIPSKP